MVASFRLTPNVAQGGNTLTLEVQGFSKPSDYQGKNFTIQVLEIDEGQDKGRPQSKNDLLAEFSASIVNLGTSATPKLAFDKVVRSDSAPASLPVNLPRNTPEGESLRFIPDWKPPHFFLAFAASGPPTSFLILFKGDVGERENYVYEIGFKFLFAGKPVFDSSRIPTYLDCGEVLSNNCKQTALAIYNDHLQMVSFRGVGTHFGSDYVPPDKTAFEVLKKDYNLKVTSCIGYLLDAGKIGHEKSQAKQDWKSILKFVSQGKVTTLGKGLEAAGWEGIYYNPDTLNPMDKGYKYRTVYYSLDDQPYTHELARTKRTYYGLRVHDLLINYRPTEKLWDGTPVVKQTPKDSSKISKLKAIPFGFLHSRGGDHTAIILSGEVFEVHYTEGPESAALFEKSDFETQWGFPWLSGMIHVPPGSWK